MVLAIFFPKSEIFFYWLVLFVQCNTFIFPAREPKQSLPQKSDKERKKAQKAKLCARLLKLLYYYYARVTRLDRMLLFSTFRNMRKAQTRRNLFFENYFPIILLYFPI